jgi:hypothetical protein
MMLELRTCAEELGQLIAPVHPAKDCVPEKECLSRLIGPALLEMNFAEEGQNLALTEWIAYLAKDCQSLLVSSARLLQIASPKVKPTQIAERETLQNPAANLPMDG